MSQSKTSKINSAAKIHNRSARPSSNFLASVAGIAVGVPLAVAAMTPLMHSQLAGAAPATIQARPASTTLSCQQPAKNATSAMTTAKVASTSTAQPKPAIGQPIAPSSKTMSPKSPTTAPSWRLVGNLHSNDTAVLKNTGPKSNNKVNFTTSNTTTVKNTNNLTVSNRNNQTATSGNATTSRNTSGGNSASGSASNSDSRDTTINITN
ncbi:MAG: hypothetical protein ACREGA_01330 [Candidatus Saccharimonadales bacterium]